ncbi:unnamed protein product, partial [Ectocarpus sp. 12 AP-2014]
LPFRVAPGPAAIRPTTPSPSTLSPLVLLLLPFGLPILCPLDHPAHHPRDVRAQPRPVQQGLVVEGQLRCAAEPPGVSREGQHRGRPGLRRRRRGSPGRL